MNNWHLWWEQAVEDFETAKASYEKERWYAAVFWLEQAVEKGLKACIMKNFKEMVTATHSLLFLGRKCKIPHKFLRTLRELTTSYYVARYPDALGDIPSRAYTKEDVEELFKECEKVLEWLQKQLQINK